ncbi:Neuraminidase [Dissostichus eleginoides]|uniref:Neuraminidase n=1 Tax=Dissostichus eleginoides TaxID=100907 RepID=A0AAD9F2G3_DISEL|nr:Neuraminidase [Dissostichus eleginoides]
MSRIIGVTFLLIILVDNFSSTASHAGLHVSKVHIRKCRCRVSTNEKIKCRSPLFPTNHKEKQNPIKCLCSKTNQQVSSLKGSLHHTASWISNLHDMNQWNYVEITGEKTLS